ncbi:MAG: CinA family protein, partial [Dehalococcoidia bacterium]|nr:CinA family protein [Dehalococcoidia bacterium]
MSIQENDALAARVGELLLAREARVAVAESTAGGLISARLISVSGASKWFDRGLVAYTMPSKSDTLGVSIEFLREHGTVTPAGVTVPC